MSAETTFLGEIIVKLGIVSVLVASVAGLGTLLYYAFEFSPSPSALNNLKSGTWSEEVKINIQHLYTYLFFSIYNCLIFAFLIFNNDKLFCAFTSRGIMVVDFVIQVIVKNGEAFTRLDSTGIFSMQRLAWFLYTIFVGGLTSSTFLHGVEVVKVSIYMTCIIVSLLVIMALTGPCEKFSAWKKTLGTFQMAILVSSLGSMVLPVTTTLGAIFFSVSFYGGLIFFSASFLCHAQEAQLAASGEGGEPFCALAKSVPMLLDTISIFTRIVVLVPPL